MEDADAWRMTNDLHVMGGKGDPFAAAVRATRMAMVITDPRQEDNPIIFVNDAFLNLTGYSREEVLGRNCRFLQGQDTDTEARRKIREALNARQDISIDILNYQKNGTPFWNALYISPVTNENDELMYFFASQLDATARVEKQLALVAEKERITQEGASREQKFHEEIDNKNLLMHEIDHRVKNNLQMISALIIMQNNTTNDPTLQGALQAILHRVEALSSVHRRLYMSTESGYVNISDVIRDIANDLAQPIQEIELKLEMHLESVVIPAEMATPIGLIVNELITNAIKHAFKGREKGTISLSVTLNAQKLHLVIADDGVGMMPKNASISKKDAEYKSHQSFGQKLISALSRQLHAVIDTSSSSAGMRYELTIPVPELPADLQ
jgi:PAS domain S-box-containing protein